MILGFSYWLDLKYKEKILLAEPVYFSDGILREFLKQIQCKDQTKKAEKYQTLEKYSSGPNKHVPTFTKKNPTHMRFFT